VDIRGFEAGDTDAVVALWEACELTRPWNDPYRDVERKVAVDDGMFLVGTIDGVVVASVMGGYDGHRGWVNYLAVAPERRGGGSARALMAEVEARLRAAGCPKVNLQVRDTNAAVVAFYERLGYRVEPVTSLGLRLEPDDARSGPRRDGSAADTAP
jgi:ribosomal protein S18 acetylase RimI-like enzyme